MRSPPASFVINVFRGIMIMMIPWAKTKPKKKVASKIGPWHLILTRPLKPRGLRSPCPQNHRGRLITHNHLRRSHYFHEDFSVMRKGFPKMSGRRGKNTCSIYDDVTCAYMYALNLYALNKLYEQCRIKCDSFSQIIQLFYYAPTCTASLSVPSSTSWWKQIGVIRRVEQMHSVEF